MFDKLMGKKKKEVDFFRIPEKRYTTDSRIINKMSTKALQELITDQEKYISVLIDKLQHAKTEYEKITDKVEELQEKNEVVNAQVSRMNNQHEQLTIKFDNLQTSLQMFSKQSDQIYRKQVQYLTENQVTCDKARNLNAVIAIYRQKLQLCKKIQMQNKNLKAKYAELEQHFQQMKTKLEQAHKQQKENDIVPSLTREIQQLKEKLAQMETKEQDNREDSIKIRQNLSQKIKIQMETASTLRSDEEDHDEKNKVAQIQLERMSQELFLSIQQLRQSIAKRQQAQSSLSKNTQQLVETEKQLFQANAKISELQGQLQSTNEQLNKQRNQVSKQAPLSNELQKATAQISRLRTEIQNITIKTEALNQNIIIKQQQSNKYKQQVQLLKHTLITKQQELVREKQNKAALQNIMADKNNSQIDQLLKIKAKLEEDLNDLKKILQNSKKTVREQQLKIKQLSDQIQSIKIINRNLVEQKKFLQQNANNCLKISQQQTQKYKHQVQQHRKQVEELKRQVETVMNKGKVSQDQIKNYAKQTQLLNRMIQTKEAELKKSYATLQQLQKQKVALQARIGQIQQDNKIRMRKYESELNQQRIKMESMNRKLATLQTKAEQNKTSMDNMYEQLLAKQKKNMHMETKLKEYKYMIQLLKKQKSDLEKTYQNKINGMRSSVEISVDQNKKQHLPVVQEEPDSRQKDNLTNQLLSIKQQNLVLLAQNKELRKTIDQLKDLVHEKQRSIKQLQERRDQMMKQIQKVGKKSGKASDITGLLSPTSQNRTQQTPRENRQKKIASKAHKGFQILMKLQHQLYKGFVSVFTKQLERDDVKKIQCEINTLIKKSSDMCDIFEDYL